MLARSSRHLSRQRQASVIADVSQKNMKSLFYAILAIVSISSVLADDFVVESFSINSSFPNPEHLLEQEIPKNEGKDVRIPYMMCGVLTEEYVLKYSTPFEHSQKASKSKVALPNGGIAEVTITKEQTIEGVVQFDSNIRITGPGSNNAEMTITTYSGQGIIIRCDTNEKRDPQLILLQIKKG
jgi:hypothetical protein